MDEDNFAVKAGGSMGARLVGVARAKLCKGCIVAANPFFGVEYFSGEEALSGAFREIVDPFA